MFSMLVLIGALTSSVLGEDGDNTISRTVEVKLGKLLGVGFGLIEEPPDTLEIIFTHPRGIETSGLVALEPGAMWIPIKRPRCGAHVWHSPGGNCQ